MQNRLKETKSQERLINLMLQAGVEWPEHANYAVQGGESGNVHFSKVKPLRNGPKHWTLHGRVNLKGKSVTINDGKPLPNWHQTVITREQYEARDGWITWHGGDCPEHIWNDYPEIMQRDGGRFKGIIATGWRWQHARDIDDNEPGADIIAYRIHKDKREVERCEAATVNPAEPCESVKACIPDQPTIERRIKDWLNQGEIIAQLERAVEKAQRELDDAKAEADKGRDEIEKALAELGWPNAVAAQPEPEQSVITDWRDLRVGDVVWWSGDSNFSDGEYVVDDIDFDDESMPFYLADGDWVRHEKEKWKFIRRP